MIDFDRIGEGLAGLLGAAQAVGGGSVLDVLQQAGLAPESLAELGPDQIAEALAQNGIDLAQLAPDQLQELSGLLGGDLPALGEMMQSVARW